MQCTTHLKRREMKVLNFMLWLAITGCSLTSHACFFALSYTRNSFDPEVENKQMVQVKKQLSHIIKLILRQQCKCWVSWYIKHNNLLLTWCWVVSDMVLSRKELSKSTKLNVVNATMMPSLLYDVRCGVWQSSSKGECRLPKWACWEEFRGWARVKNEEIRQWLGQEDILHVMRRRQEKWKCKLDDMNSDRTTKKVNIGVMDWRRPRGRPMMRWIDNY